MTPLGQDDQGQRGKDSFFLFTGYYWHGQSGLYLAKYRAYDPNLGRWISRDPLGEAGGLNLYAYVENDPIQRIDPFGLDVWIEGPSGREPQGHQSINAGDPNGQYRSFSFGLDTPYLVGHPYIDEELGGEIEDYEKTNNKQDSEMLEELWKWVLEGKGKMYGPTTCRTWSQDQFDEFVKKYELKHINPPKRNKPTERSWWRYPSSSLAPTSSTTSSSNLYPGGPSR